MPVPKRKRSRARRDKRFANKGLQVKSVACCKNCQAPCLPHSVCKQCGYYKGIKVLATKAERALKRGEAKKAKAARSAKVQESAPVEEPKEEKK